MNQNRAKLERKHVETQGTVKKFSADLEELTRPLNSFKPASGSALGEVQGKISTEVSNRLSATKQEVTHLSEELEKQNKSAAGTMLKCLGTYW